MAEKTQTRRGPLGWVKRHKKLTNFLAILLVAALVLVNVLGKTDKAAADSYQFVRTTVLTKTTLSDTVSVTGTVKAGSSASVTANDRAHTPQMAHSVLLLCFIAVSLCKTGHPCKHVL